MEGMEIVITPRTIERAIYIAIITALAVLLIVRWTACGPAAPGEESNASLAVDTQQDNSGSNYEDTLQANSFDSCKNGVKDGSETDVDCGGECGGCAEYKTCNIDADCSKEFYCFQHIKCLAPSCDDGVKNQDETNVDCGGVCGGYFWKLDEECHDKKEPSGKLDATLTVVAGKSPNSGNAVLESMTIKFDNGQVADATIDAYFYARTPNNNEVFYNQDEEIAFETAKFSIKTGEKLTKTIDLTENTRRVLPSIRSTEKYQIVMVMKDSLKKTLIDEVYWVNE